MRRRQGAVCNNFIEIIAKSDLHIDDKLKILEYTADEHFIKDENLEYLECKQAIKELGNETR